MALFVTGFFQPALAKAYFAPRDEMINKSQYIAVVTITMVGPTEEKGKHWNYSQKAMATVEKNIKGQLPPHITMVGGENFICARVQYQTGRYLVFLNKDEGLFVGANWHLSLRPIQDNQVEWYVDGSSSSLNQEYKPLDEVLQYLYSQVAPK